MAVCPPDRNPDDIGLFCPFRRVRLAEKGKRGSHLSEKNGSAKTRVAINPDKASRDDQSFGFLFVRRDLFSFLGDSQISTSDPSPDKRCLNIGPGPVSAEGVDPDKRTRADGGMLELIESAVVRTAKRDSLSGKDTNIGPPYNQTKEHPVCLFQRFLVQAGFQTFPEVSIKRGSPSVIADFAVISESLPILIEKGRNLILC